MIKHKTAPILFVIGTIFALMFFGRMTELFEIINGSKLYTRIDPTSLILASGYIVWMSWFYLTFSKRGSLTNIILWSLTLVHTLAMMATYIWAVGFWLFFYPYLIWHLITLSIAYYSFRKDLDLFRYHKKLSKVKA